MTHSIPRRALAFLALAMMMLAAVVLGQVALSKTTSPAAATTIAWGDGNLNTNRVQNSAISDGPVLIADNRGGSRIAAPGQTVSADSYSSPEHVAVAAGGVALHRLIHPNGYVQPWVTVNGGSAGNWIHTGDAFRFFGCGAYCMVQVMYDPPTPPSQHTDCNFDLHAGCIENVSSLYSLIVCENWSGTTADPGCANSSETQNVAPGNWSTYYDADGYYIPAGYNAIICYADTPACTLTGTGWVKVGNARNHQIALTRE